MSMAKMDWSSISKEKDKVVIDAKCIQTNTQISVDTKHFWFLFRDLVVVAEGHPGVLLRYQ